jgi:hypothetical protein
MDPFTLLDRIFFIFSSGLLAVQVFLSSSIYLSSFFSFSFSNSVCDNVLTSPPHMSSHLCALSDAFGVTPLDLLEAHAGKLTNLPYTFVKDGKPKPKQASYPAAKDWVTSGPYGDGGWPTSATVAEEGEKREKELLFPGGSMDTCDFAEVDGEYVAAHPERYVYSTV